MYVVAIAGLASPTDADVAAVAADLGASVYDARLALAATRPAIVLTSQDRARAVDVLAKLRARGYEALACDSAAVVSSDAMVSMRRFRFDDDALEAIDLAGKDGRTTERLPYDDIAALLPAIHRRHTEKHMEQKERKFSAARAVISGGLVMRKSVTSTTSATIDERDHVLYVFRRSGETPWIVREHDTQYSTLAARLAPSALENFNTVVTMLRERATRAIYDARLLTARRVIETAKLTGDSRSQTMSTSSASGVDLLAHLLAMWLAKTAP